MTTKTGIKAGVEQGWRVWVVLLAMALGSCKGQRQGNRPLGRKLPHIEVHSPTATPAHNMSRSEYPFDSAGNYHPEWVVAGGGNSSHSHDDHTHDDHSHGEEFESIPVSINSGGGVERPAQRVVETPPRPKPKPKPQRKPQLAAVRHKVVKGDTLSSLSRRYGVSISSIQKANGLSGTNIMLGATLKIPK